MHKAAYLYLLRDTGEPNRPEMGPGLRCVLEDVSDTGCAVTVGGNAESGLRVKIQFALANQAVCMPGTVRSLTYKEDTNRSLLRLESDTLPQYTRNLILGEVFGTQESFDDDLPFQMLDEEAANVGSPSYGGGNESMSNDSRSDFFGSNASDDVVSSADFGGSPFDKFAADDTADKSGF
jgi:hypothetical protein